MGLFHDIARVVCPVPTLVADKVKQHPQEAKKAAEFAFNYTTGLGLAMKTIDAAKEHPNATKKLLNFCCPITSIFN